MVRFVEALLADRTPMPRDRCAVVIAMKENRPIRGTEAVAERPDGTRVAFIPFPTPLHDALGALVGAANMLVDISHQKQVPLARGEDAFAPGSRSEGNERGRAPDVLRRTRGILHAGGQDWQARLEAELARAVEAGEFRLLYQRATGKRARPLPVPFAIWKSLAIASERLPGVPLTRNQIALMERDNVASPARVKRLPSGRQLSGAQACSTSCFTTTEVSEPLPSFSKPAKRRWRH